MAITKRELSDLVRDGKFGGDPVLGKIHPTIIWKTADTVIGKFIEQAMFKTPDSNGYEINGDFLTTKTAPVKYDEDRDEKYSILPAQVISLKKNRGLHRVSELKNKENAFTQVGNGSNDIFSILDVHYLNSKTEFYQEGDKIYYRNIGVTVDKVMIKMVAGISHLDPDELIPIPAIMEDDFIERIKDILTESRVLPQDKNNDNNPNMTK